MTINKVFKKFQNKKITAKGEARGKVPFHKLETLWFNTGTLCNLKCSNCYIESSPKNDRLQYLTRQDVLPYLTEIKELDLPVKLIGLTGGEPFINPHIFELLEEILRADLNVIVLTNGYRVLKRNDKKLLSLKNKYKEKLSIRVSLDHYSKEIHENERGKDTFVKTLEGIRWLDENHFSWTLAGRSLVGENQESVKLGYQKLLLDHGISHSLDLEKLIIFPEMIMGEEVPEISESCWGILKVSKNDQMCATSRMVIRKKDDPSPKIQACTLLAYQNEFSLGQSLKESFKTVYLNHEFCSKFCVLGEASCIN